MEIVSGVHLVHKGYSNVYLVVRKDALILIDVGMERDPGKILDYIKKIGRKPEDIKYILITHTHMDHIRCLKELKNISNAKVAVHKSEANILSGKEPMLLPKGFLGFFFKLLMPLMKYQPVDPDILLEDGRTIEGLKTIYTPGHTPGSVCFYDERKKILFSGDAIILENGKLSYVKSNFNTDEDAMKISAEKISKIKFNVMLPGHGGILRSKASEKVKKFVEQQKK